MSVHVLQDELNFPDDRAIGPDTKTCWAATDTGDTQSWGNKNT